MNNSQFWGQSSGSNNVPRSTNKVSGSSPKSTKLAKGLGVTGVIILVVVAVLAGLGYFFVVKPSYDVISAINLLKSDSSQIGVAMQGRDLVALDLTLNKTEKDLDTFKTQRDKSFGWAKNIPLFKVNEFYSDSDRFVQAGHDSVAAIKEIEKVVTPFADAAGLKVSASQQAPVQKGLMQAFQSWISLMPQVAGQMDGVIAAVSKVGNDLGPVNVDKYPENIQGIQVRQDISFIKDTLSKANDYGPDIKQALTIFPGTLGVNTPVKRYMIIMQNDKEIRPTGGFMTNYATFKIDNGLLQSDFTSKDMYSVDLTLNIIDATYTFPTAPPAYQKYLKNTRWYARDMNYSPDFVTSMDQFMKFYNMAGRISPAEVKPVDGIVAIDTQVISELLAVTGPVTVNGVTYTKDNVVLELERIASLELQEQANRKKVLGDLMQAMLINVFESDKNLWAQIIQKGVDLSMRKHIQAYLFDPQAEALVDKYGLGGRIATDVKGDYLAVISTNLGGDKTNWFVHKDVTSTVEKSGNRWLRTVAVKYTYTQPDSQFDPFVKGFKDWLRIYAPVGSEFVSVDGSEDGTTTDQESNKVWFSGYVELTPGQTKTMTFKYYLPEGTVGPATYNLTLQKQGGIDSEPYTFIYGNQNKKIDLTQDQSVSFKL